MQDMKTMDSSSLARLITKVGVILIENGAETYRVEDTMYRIAKAYGAETVDSYATPTLLIISFTLNGELTHNIKRVSMKSIDLTKIDKINTLSRKISEEPLSFEEFDRCLKEIEQGEGYSFSMILVGAMICSLGFAFFFGGSIPDALASMVIAMVIKAFLYRVNRLELSSFFANLFSGALLTFLAILLSWSGYLNRDIVIISSMMILVPGLAITNAIRDSVSGDLISGLSRATEALFIAVSIAIGSGLVMMLMGGM